MKGNFIRPLFVFFIVALLFAFTVQRKETALFTQRAYGKKILSLAPRSLLPFSLPHPDKVRGRLTSRRDYFYPTSLLPDLLAALLSPGSIYLIRNIFLFLLILFSLKLLGDSLLLWALVLFPFSLLIREATFFSPLFLSYSLIFPFLLFLKQKKISSLLLVLFFWSLSHESFLIAFSLLLIFPLPFRIKGLALLFSLQGFLTALPYYFKVSFVDRLIFFPSWAMFLYLVGLFPLFWKSGRERQSYFLLFLIALYALYPYLLFVEAVSQFADRERIALEKISQHPFLQDIYLPRTETALGILFFAGGLFFSFRFLKQPLPFYRGTVPFLTEVKHPRGMLFCYGHTFGDRLHQKGVLTVVVDSRGNYAFPPYLAKRLYTLTPSSLELPCDSFILPPRHPLSDVLRDDITFLKVSQRQGWQLFYRLTPESLARIPPRLLPIAKRKIARIYVLQAQEVVRRQHPKNAISLLEKALAFYPDMDIYANLAGLYLSTDQLKKAKQLLDTAERREPLHPGILCNQGFLHEKLKEWKKALAYYQKCRDFSPPNRRIGDAIRRVQKKVRNKK